MFPSAQRLTHQVISHVMASEVAVPFVILFSFLFFTSWDGAGTAFQGLEDYYYFPLFL